MGKKLYVGNLSYTINDNDLRQMFAEHGSVVSAQVILEKGSNRSKGFGFVEMQTEEAAQAAIAALNAKNIAGRALTVNVARPLEPRNNNGGAQRRGRDKPSGPRRHDNRDDRRPTDRPAHGTHKTDSR